MKIQIHHMKEELHNFFHIYSVIRKLINTKKNDSTISINNSRLFT